MESRNACALTTRKPGEGTYDAPSATDHPGDCARHPASALYHRWKWRILMASTASGLLDAHGYFYAGLQSVVFGVLLNMSGSPWPLVFLLMASTRVLCGVLIFL
jgi:hypothetical protein